MARVDVTVEPYLEVQEATAGPFEVDGKLLNELADLERQHRRVQRAILEVAIASNPDHPDVPALREYLKETG